MQILKVLVEDFGGEANCSSLHGKLARKGQIPPLFALESEDSICRRLEDLESAGLLTLETTRSGNLIARITREGAVRNAEDFEAARNRAWQTEATVGAA
ncbi:hypothetical protein [Frigidibacter sp. ROC022]|uniref:hypothetical protein n=1 Tax=Frigidibacter sp. ROC022 TaxID=2971796 RepID=UPI00215B60C5|nr:hypothetical protein [Frigidibacter sp. ROC022]MCR8724695.1 hypothetical protein [Frigidibacter sp. ROC022]